MFRVTTTLTNIRTLLHCHRTLDYHLAAIIGLPRYHSVRHYAVGSPRLRDPCLQPPPPPPKPPKDDALLWGTICAIFIAGVGVVAAKHSPEIRDWLTIYAPVVDNVIAIIYQENMSYSEFAAHAMEVAKQYIDKQRGITQAPKKEKESPEVVLPVMTQDICSIERCLKELGEFAIVNYDTAKTACTYYNSLVDVIMNTEFSMESFKKLCDAKCEREALVKESLTNATNTVKRIEEMLRYLDCGVAATKQELENTKLMTRNYEDLYKARYMEFQWANDYSLARDRMWESVKDVVTKYTGEMESLFAPYKYVDNNSTFQGDPDILLYSTYRLAKQLEVELADASSVLSDRVNRAYQSLSQDPEKVKAREASVKAVYLQKQAEYSKQEKAMFEAQKKKNECRLQQLTAKQLAEHEAALEKNLAATEKRVSKKLETMVEDQVEKEKRVFAAQLMDMALRLQVVEDKYNERLKAERETRRSQELWAAGASLLAATKKGDKTVNVCKELTAIEKAAGDDKLVKTLLKSIPPQVREKGIVPESVLKEAYKTMEDAALKIALVEEDGAVMPVYALSWLQAILLFMKIPGIPQKEFEHPSKEPCKSLDTFDLLQRARFWMLRGNVAQALHYVNYLKGASRLAAHNWYEDARGHVEVRQAAEAIIAHAAALALQYI